MAETLYRATPRGREEIPEEKAAEIRAEWAKNEAEREATAWLRHRTGGKVTSHIDEDGKRVIDSTESGYPSMADQLDYIYHNGIAKWKSDMVKPVKDAHPKPE